jgi:hypothetical protein
VQSNVYTQHCRTAPHLARARVFNYLNAVALTQQDRNGVELSGPATGLDLGLRPLTQQMGDPEVLWISHTCPTNVSLVNARTSASLGVRPGLQLWYVNVDYYCSMVQLTNPIDPQF